MLSQAGFFHAPGWCRGFPDFPISPALGLDTTGDRRRIRNTEGHAALDADCAVEDVADDRFDFADVDVDDVDDLVQALIDSLDLV
jgi:hypothetical protein